MTVKFEANNNLSAHESFFYRTLYELYAYPENNGLGPPVIRNLTYAEMQYYGRVNMQGNSIVPKEINIRSFNVGSGDATAVLSKRALNVVTRAHLDVRRNLELNITFGKYNPTNESMATMRPKRAYESPRLSYESYIGGIIATFNQNYLIKVINTHKREGFSNQSPINSFEDYVKYFMRHMRESFLNTPITFTGWNLSGLNSIFSTGLAFSIMDLEFGDNIPKGMVINDFNFDYYKRINMNKGFMIPKNIPWVLVADIGSPAMVPYLDKIGVKQIEEFFVLNYDLTHFQDLIILKAKLINGYNDFVFFNEYDRNIRVNCNNGTIITYNYRNNIDLINNKYIDSPYWLKIYLDLRNLELGNPISRTDLEGIRKRAYKFRIPFDNSASMDYINNVFRFFQFTKPFGMLHQRKRLNNKKKFQLMQKLTGGGSGTSSGGSGGGSGTGGGSMSGGSGGGY